MAGRSASVKQQVKIETKHNRTLGWGLNLAEPEVTTQEEIDEFRRVSAQQLGVQQDGLDFWLDMNPEVLKRYRLWADKLRVVEADEAPNKWSATGVMIHYVYSMTNFQQGLHYGLAGMSRSLTKAQILEQYALVFRYVGPRGMAAIADAARGHTWPEPTNPARWPKGWGPDPDAFKSGADFRSPNVTEEDTRKILAWYERWCGEVPRHVRLLARYRPELLKVYRQRFENTLRLLPKHEEPGARGDQLGHVLRRQRVAGPRRRGRERRARVVAGRIRRARSVAELRSSRPSPSPARTTLRARARWG
jgi:hypothetical protein